MPMIVGHRVLLRGIVLAFLIYSAHAQSTAVTRVGERGSSATSFVVQVGLRDYFSAVLFESLASFQSAPARGGRPSRARNWERFSRFQSCPCAGRKVARHAIHCDPGCYRPAPRTGSTMARGRADLGMVRSKVFFSCGSDRRPSGPRPAASGQAGLGRAANARRAIERDPCPFGEGAAQEKIKFNSAYPLRSP